MLASFPYFRHRTMAEVQETQALALLVRMGRHLAANEMWRLRVLLALHDANNPPETWPPPGAA